IVWAGASLKQNRVWKDNITLFEHNLSADPGSPQARASLALEYFFQRRPAEAEREARAAVELDPNCLDGYIASGYMAENSGAIDQAIEHLERAVSTVSERPANRSVLASIHARLGWLYAKRKEELRAEESFRRAAGMVDDPQILFEMGQFYFEQGRYNEARELFEQTARQVSPRIASVHLRLGRVYDRLGQPDRARHEFMMYLDLSPKGKARKEVMARLSQL
ncbi:MAG TPA: tetratricopeptide repeat protein, partial [Blastocatellia bacterium]|nr:tetratricopeptide repeat protein [Blastocatellia bacterium]